jgi:transketolase
VRDVFCQSLVAQASQKGFVFLTGDLGYLALEPLQQTLGERFINAGIAEQNMVSVAAGMAKNAMRPWVYSIAPFLYARAFEQIRNDVCLHALPVVLVGNGGGYGYGVMGATHHALEDYGVLLALPNLRAYIPAFDADVPAIVSELFRRDTPSYLRLGRDEKPADLAPPEYSVWRKVLSGNGPTLVIVGPLTGLFWRFGLSLPEDERPNVWCLSELRFDSVPQDLWNDIATTKNFGIVEEHVLQGSAGLQIASMILKSGVSLENFQHFTACGYPSGRYGSQAFHRQESGLLPEQVLSVFRKLDCEV